MTNTKRLLLPQCCEYSIYPPPTTLEKTNNFLGALACARSPLSYRPPPPPARRTVGQIPQKCKETSNLMWLSLIWFILVLFVCWNLFCIIANLRIKCVTEPKKFSVLFYKNLKSSFLHDSHIWLWGFFTLLVALVHGAAGINQVLKGLKY